MSLKLSNKIESDTYPFPKDAVFFLNVGLNNLEYVYKCLKNDLSESALLMKSEIYMALEYAKQAKTIMHSAIANAELSISE